MHEGKRLMGSASYSRVCSSCFVLTIEKCPKRQQMGRSPVPIRSTAPGRRMAELQVLSPSGAT